MPDSMSTFGRRARPPAVIANLLVIGILVYIGLLHESDFERYYATLQEDEALEWATFWGFMGASVLYAKAAFRQRAAGVSVPWFLAGVSLFTFVIGMEEISWAQRVFSYRPPEYFLENNFQQEFNFHNIMSNDLRKTGLKLVVLSYGVVLPLLGITPPIRRLFDRVGIAAPTPLLIPAFGATYALYEEYPWKYTGETVELMLATSFLFSATWSAALHADPPPDNRRMELSLYRGLLGILLLGFATSELSHLRKGMDPLYAVTTQAETDALARDFERIARRPGGRLASSCDVHKRVYSYTEKYGGRVLDNGKFAALVPGGLPEERAEFFLDPWNGPYWIRDRCADSDEERPRRTFVYSFGPNMKRDSSQTRLAGDDIGTYIYDTAPDDERR